MAKSFLAALAIFLLAPAGKTQDTLPPWGLTPRTGPPPVSTPATGSPLTLTVPAETEAAVQLLSGIHTQVSHLNDPVKARLVQPVYVNGRVALPRESLLDGRITMIHRAGRLGHSAELAFRFDQITLPDGQAAPIAAVLAALDNPRSGGLSEGWACDFLEGRRRWARRARDVSNGHCNPGWYSGARVTSARQWNGTGRLHDCMAAGK